jgi:tetratricopeptide (TPR) repeat protein
MSSSISQIARTDVGGVPVLHATQPQGSPFLAQLVFRVGISDETLPLRGITHLVEHLALPVTQTPPVEFNGVVMGPFTHFWFSGPRDATLRLFEETCAALADLPLRRLERERALLTTEAETSSPGPLGGALALRFGAVGHGLPGFAEVGLPRISRADVSRWAAERFNLGTVAIAFSGEPPAELHVPLPDGSRLEPAKPEPIRDLETPSVFSYATEGGVWATLIGERSYGMSAVLWTLRRRLEHRLRGRRSLSYGVMVDHEPLTTDELHAIVHADCLPHNQDAVAATIVATIDELSANGPTALELDEYVAERERDDANDAFLSGALFWYAGQAAYGEPFESPEDLKARTRAVTPSDASDALRNAASTLLLGIAPGGSIPGGRFKRYPTDSRHRVEGRRYRRRGLPIVGRKDNEQELIVGDEGVTLVGEDGALEEKYVKTVLFDELAGAVVFADDVIQLYGLDGHDIVIDPSIWRRSRGLLAEVEKSIPTDRLVDLRGEASGFIDEDLVAGAAAFEKEDWEGAIPLLTAGLEREPENEHAWVLLGSAHLAIHNRTAAADAARKAVELAPDDTEPRRLFAHALMELGRGDEAVEHTRKLLELEPGDLQTLSSAIFLLVQASYESEALAIAERAVELFPESSEAHFARGWAAQALGDFTSAQASLERAITIEPVSMAYNNLGWVLLQKGQLDAALARFDRALELDPNNLYSVTNRALALRLLGRHEEASRAWRSRNEARLENSLQKLETDPLDSDALWHRHQLHWNLGRDEDALSSARDAVDRLPEDPILWRSLTQFELVTGHVDLADEAAEQALALESETFDSLEFAAWYGAYAEGADARKRAAIAAEDALERRPDSTGGWATAGYGELAAGNSAEAVGWFDKAIERKPLGCCHHAGRALAHLANGDRAQAERDLSRADTLSHGRCRDALFVRALLAEKTPA